MEFDLTFSIQSVGHTRSPSVPLQYAPHSTAKLDWLGHTRPECLMAAKREVKRPKRPPQLEVGAQRVPRLAVSAILEEVHMK